MTYLNSSILITSMKTKFKVGDLVKCIDAGYYDANSIKNGETYTVLQTALGSTSNMVIVNNGHNNKIYESRFVLLKKAPKINNIHLSKNDIDVLKRIIKRYEDGK